MVRSDGPALKICLLGLFRVAVADLLVEPRQWKRRAASNLVGLLALSPGHRLHRDVAMSHLWPESTGESASNSLYKSVHAARRALESACGTWDGARLLAFSQQLLVLGAPAGVSTDVEEFERSAADALRDPSVEAFDCALALYTGDLMFDDLAIDWVDSRRYQLRALRERMLFGLAELHGAAGAREAAIEALGRLILMDPGNEEAHRRAMLLHAEAADISSALRQFEFCRLALRRELDVEPEEQTLALHRAIAAGEVRPKSRPAAGIHGSGRPPSFKRLPNPATSFIGRARDTAAVSDLLHRFRLVTITGIGGVGKSRLALRVAESAAGDLADDVSLIALAPIADPAFVGNLLAGELGIEEQSGHPLLESVCDGIRERRLLIVLDNCEHVPDGSTSVVNAVLGRCPNVRFLCTSRVPLGADGEVLWKLRPLDSARASGDGASTEPGTADAVRLFADRACRSDPAFTISPGNVESVAELCRKVDGIPLAIEFAAARVRTMSVSEMLANLDSMYELRAGDPVTRDRQRTLGEVLDWSYSRLSERERRLLRGLSVFAGGWTLAAAEAVCADRSGDGVLSGLGQLVDASLVVPTVGDHSTRYRMLETVRRYGLDELRRCGEYGQVAAKYRDWLTQLALQSEAGLKGEDQAAWLGLLEAEHDNFRSVLDHGAELGGVERLRLCRGLAHFWSMRGHWREGLSRLEMALASRDDAPPGELAHALHGAGVLEQRLASLERSTVYLEESLHIRRGLGDLGAIAETLGFLGYVQFRLGNCDSARELLGEAARLSTEAGDLWVLAFASNQLGTLAGSKGDNAAALEAHDRSQALYREVGDWNRVASALNNVATIESRLGRTSRAIVLYREALEFLGVDGDKKTMAVVLGNLGSMCAESGRDVEARLYFERCVEVTTVSGDRPTCALAHVNLAELHAAEGQAESAAANARACLRLATGQERETILERAVRVLESLAAGDS